MKTQYIKEQVGEFQDGGPMYALKSTRSYLPAMLQITTRRIV